jgi:hypothetical protein
MRPAVTTRRAEAQHQEGKSSVQIDAFSTSGDMAFHRTYSQKRHPVRFARDTRPMRRNKDELRDEYPAWLNAPFSAIENPPD